MSLAHEGHQGLVKTKALIRERVWFPGIDRLVEQTVESCLVLGGIYLLVVIDDYSRFPVVEITSSTSAQTVIPHIDRIFSEYGVPDVVRTDNGPPFNSREYKLYAENTILHHITPLWLRANGEVERFMKTIKKTIKAANVENKCWEQEMYRFLRNYRATPHAPRDYHQRLSGLIAL